MLKERTAGIVRERPVSRPCSMTFVLWLAEPDGALFLAAGTDHGLWRRVSCRVVLTCVVVGLCCSDVGLRLAFWN